MKRLLVAAGLLAFSVVSPALAQSSITGGGSGFAIIETYYAFLSADDHYNSKGVRLTAPWQIIRQDRANYHRFGVRDNGDEWDSFFGSATNRARMESMLQNGWISQSASRAIVNGEVWIRVDLLGKGSRATAVQVEVQ